MKISPLGKLSQSGVIFFASLLFDPNVVESNTDGSPDRAINSQVATSGELKSIRPEYVLNTSNNTWFVNKVRDAAGSIPAGARNFIFSPQNGQGYKIFVTDKLLSELYPDCKDTLYYATGCTSSWERRIDISTQVRRQIKSDKVEDYQYPKNNAYHELGHAFDNMLFEFYFSDVVKDTSDRYYSFHSKNFNDAYNADLKELKKKVEDRKIPKAEADRIMKSYYITETENTSGREETFAEVFCMIMLGFETNDSWKGDYKRNLQFLSYFPRIKQVVLDQIELVSPGFKKNYERATKLSSG